MIPTNSLKRVHDFAVPPGGHGNTFRCVRRVGLFNNEMVVTQVVFIFAVLMMTQLAVKSIKIRNDDEGNIRKAQKVGPSNVTSISTLIFKHFRPS
jgi:hypothetical protein